uniref:Uncharacterized protein n=1 Tax=Chenopodium quinoa TaxID=63459 RepID=A0A803KUJ8_CHEQI
MGSLRIMGSVKATFEAEGCGDVIKVSTLPRPKGKLMFVKALVNGRTSWALVDMGASHNFIAKEEASKLGVEYAKEPDTLKTVNASPVPILGISRKVPLSLGDWSDTVDITVVNMDDFALVLGLEFMDSVRPFSFERDRSMTIVKDQGAWSVPITREEVEAKMISSIHLEKGVKKGQETFLATLVENEPYGGEVPSEIAKVLEENDYMSSSYQSAMEVPKFCKCGIPVGQKQSWTTRNPRRRFVCCKFYNPRIGLNGCNTFTWVDDTMNEW